MIRDYHVHCHYSDDSWYPMEDVVKDAIAKGIGEICFTDHVDYGVKLDWDDLRPARLYKGEEIRNVNYPEYFKEIDYLQHKYKGQIIIKKGLEFGIQTHTINEFQKLYDTYPMDFVLLSIHQVNDLEFWTFDYQKGKTDIESYNGYYEEMYNVISEFKDYSCLSHMDLIRRYIDKDIDMFQETKPWIEKILKRVIEDGKGIEINTSSVRYGINGMTPSLEILLLYKELGGRIITVGSDSHQYNHLGFGIQDAYDVLKSLGFEKICVYSNMIPTFVDF